MAAEKAVAAEKAAAEKAAANEAAAEKAAAEAAAAAEKAVVAEAAAAEVAAAGPQVNMFDGEEDEEVVVVAVEALSAEQVTTSTAGIGASIPVAPHCAPPQDIDDPDEEGLKVHRPTRAEETDEGWGQVGLPTLPLPLLAPGPRPRPIHPRYRHGGTPSLSRPYASADPPPVHRLAIHSLSQDDTLFASAAKQLRTAASAAASAASAAAPQASATVADVATVVSTAAAAVGGARAAENAAAAVDGVMEAA